MQFEFVANLHVTERCNFGCSYCFGKWGIGAHDGVFEELSLAKSLISDILSIFPVAPFNDAPIRLNFVGGEPALLKPLPELIEYCSSLGIRMSFVTNGLMFQRFSPKWLATYFDVVGLSIDSVSREPNLQIGRSTRSGTTLDLEKISERVLECKALGTAVKVNTVVSASNFHEDFSRTIRHLRPSRWKIFQVLPVYNGSLRVEAYDLDKFLARHKEFTDIMCVETSSEMIGSYVMIDPLGRFFCYEDGSLGYKYSQPILEIGAASAFSQIEVSWHKYAKRYIH